MRLTRLSVALVALAGAAACETDLTGLNTNPNSPTTAPAASLFTSATVSTVPRFTGNTLSLTSLFAQHVAQVQYVDEDRGRIRSTTIDGMFAGMYVVELEDYTKVIAQSTNPNIVGPARIMKAWIFQNATDLWGDIPYSEANKGDITANFKPKYDTQQSIYTDVLATLTSASAALVPGGSGFGGADPIFAGDASKWKTFANSLRARMAMRMLKADPATAGTELTAAFAAGVMASNADNAKLTWPGDGVFDNPLAATFSTRDDHRVSKTLLDTMNALADPRVKVYAQPTKADPTKYTGLQNGMNNVTVTPFFNTTSRLGTMFYPGATVYGTFGTSAGKKTPSYLMTYAEVCFLQAEAAERVLGGLSGAAAYYNAGVTASILQWGGTAAEATAYLAVAGVAYVPGATGLKQIGLQKWIALFTQGTEAWSEWRRTGNPATIAPGPSAYWPYVDRRLTYPSNEQSVNAANLAIAIARQGVDDYSTRVWWDK